MRLQSAEQSVGSHPYGRPVGWWASGRVSNPEENIAFKSAYDWTGSPDVHFPLLWPLSLTRSSVTGGDGGQMADTDTSMSGTGCILLASAPGKQLTPQTHRNTLWLSEQGQTSLIAIFIIWCNYWSVDHRHINVDATLAASARSYNTSTSQPYWKDHVPHRLSCKQMQVKKGGKQYNIYISQLIWVPSIQGVMMFVEYGKKKKKNLYGNCNCCWRLQLKLNEWLHGNGSLS